MSRKPSSTLEALIYVASKLPWWLSIGLAIASGVFLHSVATSPLPVYPDMRQFDTLLIRSAFKGFATFGQYILPITLIGGALTSLFARYKRRKRLESVANPPPRETAPLPVEPVKKQQAAPVIEAPESVKAPPAPEPPAQPAAPNCPHCKKTMVMKIARTGRNAGGNFWGCAAYPKCKGIRPIFRTS